MTFEDPVEIVVDGINQSQIFPDIGYTFASGLRTALRQDPDIMMV
jgi:type II secretory ATPase GspE/PulE/Tfp pilus assembly ATPase PilB-like protein